MKQFFYYVSIILLFVTCTNIRENNQQDILTVTSKKYDVGANGGEILIEVKANIDFEHVIEESATDWIKYTATRTLDTYMLAFDVAKNEELEKREGKIAIRSDEFNEAVTICQMGDKPIIEIKKNEYIVPSDSMTIAVEITSNVDVMVELPANAEWITESITRATATNIYCFDINPNENYVQRSAGIKFTNTEYNLSEMVMIVQAQKDAIIIAKDMYTIESDGGYIQIETNHNVDFEIVTTCDWIINSSTRNFTTETLTFNIAANYSNESRIGEIMFILDDGEINQTVKIMQTGVSDNSGNINGTIDNMPWN